MGIIVGTNFWGLFWAIIFLAIGIKMLMRQGRCPICSGYWWTGKIHEKMHGHCCDHEHEHQESK